MSPNICCFLKKQTKAHIQSKLSVIQQITKYTKHSLPPPPLKKERKRCDNYLIFNRVNLRRPPLGGSTMATTSVFRCNGRVN